MHYFVDFFKLPISNSWLLHRYFLVAYAIAFFPTLLLLSTLYLSFRIFNLDLNVWSSGRNPPTGLLDFFGLVFFSPFLETFVLSLVIHLVSKLTKNSLLTAALSAIFFAGIHSAEGPLKFVGTLWIFFIFSMGYISWRPRSYWSAYGAACMPHVLSNATIFLAIQMFQKI